MKIAITGGTGFVGRNIGCLLVSEGHELVLVARGLDRTDSGIRQLPRTHFVAMTLDNRTELAQAFVGCEAVIHCAGINREQGEESYRRVHIDGTRNVVEAARQAGSKKIILISFLRARPNCGSAYHESKWEAEEIVRRSGLDYTVLKCGVIYGQGDHMLNHLSHAFYTFPVFAFVGFKDKPIRPNAVEDVARIVKASGRCSFQENRAGARSRGIDAAQSRPPRRARGGPTPVHVSDAGLVSLPLGLVGRTNHDRSACLGGSGSDAYRGIGGAVSTM